MTLQLTLTTLQTALASKETAQTNTTKTLIAIQILSHFNSLRVIYLGKIQSLLNWMESPLPLKFIENLVTNTNYCIDFNCYRNTNFKYDSRNLQTKAAQTQYRFITMHYVDWKEHNWFLKMNQFPQSMLIYFKQTFQTKVVENHFHVTYWMGTPSYFTRVTRLLCNA